MKNYYEILEVNEKATPEIISKVFKIHIKKWHPDLYQGEEKVIAENKTKEINEAYAVLSDETKRANYDIQLQNEKNISMNDKYELETLREENEQLRAGIEKRDQIINTLVNPAGSISKEIYYDEPEYTPQQNPNPVPNENYNGQKSSYSELDRLKEFFTKILISFAIIVVGLFFILLVISKLSVLVPFN